MWGESHWNLLFLFTFCSYRRVLFIATTNNRAKNFFLPFFSMNESTLEVALRVLNFYFTLLFSCMVEISSRGRVYFIHFLDLPRDFKIMGKKEKVRDREREREIHTSKEI